MSAIHQAAYNPKRVKYDHKPVDIHASFDNMLSHIEDERAVLFSIKAEMQARESMHYNNMNDRHMYTTDFPAAKKARHF